MSDGKGHRFHGFSQGYSIVRRGVHRGVAFEVNYYSMFEDPVGTNEPFYENARDGYGIRSGHFCYYLTLLKDQVPEGLWDRFLAKSVNKWGRYDDHYETLLAGLEWHGGMTYYDRHDGLDRSWVKGGCDYNHAWGSGIEGWVQVGADARRTVDDLHSKVPGLLVRDGKTGEWLPESEASS